VDRFHDEEKEMEKKLIDKGYSVEVFVEKNEEVFCCSRSKNGSSPSWFKLGPSKTIFRLMEFIDWDVLIKKYRGIERCLEKRDKYLKKMEEKGFVKNSSDMKQLQKACQGLFEKRKSIKELAVKELKSKGKVTGVEIPLPQYGEMDGKSLFKVKVKKAKYTGSERGDYIDQASLYILVRKKYKSFDRLSTGKKNAAIMAFLMDQESFGPLIIDEPEQYLDVSSILGTLVPRMRLLKTKQQIICVTKDEHILLSGDAENVVITQSEKGIKVIKNHYKTSTGDFPLFLSSNNVG